MDQETAQPGRPKLPERVTTPAGVRRSRRWLLAIPLAAVAAALTTVLVIVRSVPGDASAPVTAIRFTLPFPDDARPLEGAQFAPSPDGTAIVLAARGPNGRSRLWIRRLRALDWRELPRTDGAAYPFWSPDSRHIGFFANRRLERIDVENGLTQAICDAPDGRGGTWSGDDQIVFAPGANGPLARVSASGGSPQPVTRLDDARQEIAHLWPRFLADGRRFVYFAYTADRRNRGSYLAEINSTRDVSRQERVRIWSHDGAAVPVGDVLLFSQNRSLAAQRFDAAGGRLNGQPETIAGAGELGGLMVSGTGFSASADVLVYRHSGPQLSRLVWVDQRGEFLGEIGSPADYRFASLSPDGARVAVSQMDAGGNTSDLWLLDLTRNTAMRLTFGADQESSPIWSPDTRRIAFASRRDGRVRLMTTSTAGGGGEQEIATWPFAVDLTDWSNDGRTLIFTARNPKTGLDVWALPMTADGKAVALMQAPFDESEARLSPDGRWIAYVSNESGMAQVYVRSFPQPGSVWQISVTGGAHPRWRRDGRELFFVAPDGTLTAVALDTGASFAPGTPKMLLPLRGEIDFTVAPDGRFLVRMADSQDTTSQLHVVLNWMTELSRQR